MKQRCTPQKSNRKMPKNGHILTEFTFEKETIIFLGYFLGGLFFGGCRPKYNAVWIFMFFLLFRSCSLTWTRFFVESYIRVMINTQKHWRIDTTNVYFSILKILLLDCCLIFPASKWYVYIYVYVYIYMYIYIYEYIYIYMQTYQNSRKHMNVIKSSSKPWFIWGTNFPIQSHAAAGVPALPCRGTMSFSAWGDARGGRWKCLGSASQRLWSDGCYVVSFVAFKLSSFPQMSCVFWGKQSHSIHGKRLYVYLLIYHKKSSVN